MDWRFVPLNAAIFARLSKDVELEKVEIDPELDQLEPGARGLYKGPKIEKFFISSGETPRGVMGHSVIYPAKEYDYPSFGYDWGVFVIPKAYVFTLVDLHPLRKSEDYTKQYVDSMKPLYDKYAKYKSYEIEHRVAWAEPYRSGNDYGGRIPPENVGDSINMIVDYLDLWLKFWREAKPQKDPQLRAEAGAHLTDMRENMRARDPGRGPHIKKFGKEKTERLMDLCF